MSKKIDKHTQGFQNREWGKDAEQIAVEYFLRKGYTVRERNWKCRSKEIDIIVEHNRTIIFVEVKARKADSLVGALDAVNVRKRRLLVKAADSYMRMLPILYEYRFDIFTITGTRDDYTCKHYEDAFMPELNNGFKY